MILLQNIQKVFNKGQVNEVTALSDVTLNIEKGEYVVLVGANGSGKTTLLNVIAGAISVSSGKVILNQADVTRLAEHQRSRYIARVFQNPLSGTAPDLSILDNFRLAALRTKRKLPVLGINAAFKKQVQQHIASLGMGLENKIEQPMGSLSGGQRQALTLLMCVMDSTDILLLDEPTAALDPRSAEVIMKTAHELIKKYSLTAVLITHNLKDAHQYGNRVIQMAEGRIVRDINAAEKQQLQLPDMFGWFS